MNFPRVFRSAAAFLLAAVLLSSTAFAASRSADVIAAALGEVGNAEGPGEYSKYGEWYGLPNSYWCDMFVSWCAMRGNVPAAQFPRHCSCTEHVKLFAKMGRYQESMARGNSYIPQQGDVIFFYNNTRYPSGSVKNHTGLVLYVEDGYVYTIEGNALANRLDLSYDIVSEQRVDAMEPPDYVTVNRYPLDAPRIHGYGIPAYDDRTRLPLEGFVDLGRHAGSAALFQSLCGAGVMRPTSSHTFSPNHGMTRADFVQMTADFFGLLGHAPETVDFGDVPPGSASYDAIMAARSAGLLDGEEGNRFLPDRYITPKAAQTILNRALAYVGLKERTFTFSLGDYSYIVSPYTIRADIAKAFGALCREAPLSTAFSGGVRAGRSACWTACAAYRPQPCGKRSRSWKSPACRRRKERSCGPSRPLTRSRNRSNARSPWRIRTGYSRCPWPCEGATRQQMPPAFPTVGRCTYPCRRRRSC